ncbi:MAG: DUF5821 family protein [Halorubrum sp.]
MTGAGETALETALAGRSDLIAVGVDLEMLPAVLTARRRTDGGQWRIACRPGVVDELGRTFGLGTAVSEAVARDELVLRTASGPRPDRTLFASSNRLDALAGPADGRTLVTDVEADRVAGARESVEGWFARAAPAKIRMPHRTAVVAAARKRFGDRFGDDLEVVLDAVALDARALDRSGVVDDRTVLLALAARHDLLFTELRTWADDLNIVEKQRFGDTRRALESRGLVESIKVPLGDGRPNNRLRAVEDRLIRVDAEGFLSTVRELVESRPADGSRSGSRTGADYDAGDRPVWDRRR